MDVELFKVTGELRTPPDVLLPICSLPALTWIPPELVALPVRVNVPVPFLTTVKAGGEYAGIVIANPAGKGVIGVAGEGQCGAGLTG